MLEQNVQLLEAKAMKLLKIYVNFAKLPCAAVNKQFKSLLTPKLIITVVYRWFVCQFCDKFVEIVIPYRALILSLAHKQTCKFLVKLSYLSKGGQTFTKIRSRTGKV